MIEKEAIETVKGTGATAGDARVAVEVLIHLTNDPPRGQRETEAKVKVLQIKYCYFELACFVVPAFTLQ